MCIYKEFFQQMSDNFAQQTKESNIGRIIHDYSCNGYFSHREYDLFGAEIIMEGKDWLIIKTKENKIYFDQFRSEEFKNELMAEWDIYYEY